MAGILVHVILNKDRPDGVQPAGKLFYLDFLPELVTSVYDVFVVCIASGTEPMQLHGQLVQAVELMMYFLRPVQISGILHLGLSPFEVQAVGEIVDASFDHDLPRVYQQVAIIELIFDGRTKPKMLGSVYQLAFHLQLASFEAHRIYNPLRAELFQEEYGPVFHIPYPGLYDIGIIRM